MVRLAKIIRCKSTMKSIQRTAKEMTNQEQGSVAYELAKKVIEKIKAKAKQ